MQRLTTVNEHDVKAVDVRQEADLRIGSAFTRFLTFLLQNKWEETCSAIISYGPCQFPTLGFVVQRWWEHQAHTPEPFWKVKLQHRERPSASTAVFDWVRGRAFDPAVAQIIQEDILNEGRMAEVVRSEGRRVTRQPPEPLNTVELQKRACRATGASAQQVLQWAEELYQAGYISYPRTETNKYPETFNLEALVQEQAGDSRWGDYANALLSAGLARPRAGNQDDKAHPPIHPVKSANEGQFSGGKAKVYEFVVRHFLATVSRPAEGRSTEVEVESAGERFKASGLCVERYNYLAIYGNPEGRFHIGFDGWGSEGDLPRSYERGERFRASDVRCEEGKTEPPPLLTEPELIAAMDRAQIGTDATQASHIAKVMGERGYVQKTQGGKLQPTSLGEALALGFDRIGLRSLWQPDFRAKMESEINNISSSTSSSPSWRPVLESLTGQAENHFRQLKNGRDALVSSLGLMLGDPAADTEGTFTGAATLGPCPSGCEGDITLKKTRGGEFRIACRCDRNMDLALELLPKSAQNVGLSTACCSHALCPSEGRVRMVRVALPDEFLNNSSERSMAASAGGKDVCPFCDTTAANVVGRALRNSRGGGASSAPDRVGDAPVNNGQEQGRSGSGSRASGRRGNGRSGESSGWSRQRQRQTQGRGDDSGGGSGRQGEAGRGRGSSRAGGSSRGRKSKGGGGRGRSKFGACYRCGQTGHWANNCPNR